MGDTASEHATGDSLLRFAIAFILSWKIWGDLALIISCYETSECPLVQTARSKAVGADGLFLRRRFPTRLRALCHGLSLWLHHERRRIGSWDVYADDWFLCGPSFTIFT